MLRSKILIKVKHVYKLKSLVFRGSPSKDYLWVVKSLSNNFWNGSILIFSWDFFIFQNNDILVKISIVFYLEFVCLSNWKEKINMVLIKQCTFCRRRPFGTFWWRRPFEAAEYFFIILLRIIKLRFQYTFKEYLERMQTLQRI